MCRSYKGFIFENFRGDMFHYLLMLFNALNCIKTAFPISPSNSWQIHAQWSQNSQPFHDITLVKAINSNGKLLFKCYKWKVFIWKKNNHLFPPPPNVHHKPFFFRFEWKWCKHRARNLIFIHNLMLVWGCIGLHFLECEKLQRNICIFYASVFYYFFYWIYWKWGFSRWSNGLEWLYLNWIVYLVLKGVYFEICSLM